FLAFFLFVIFCQLPIDFSYFFYCDFFFFFFNDTATTEIYTLSLHDALPISTARALAPARCRGLASDGPGGRDRTRTRLNSSHITTSYAALSLKKKTKKN